MISFRSPGIEAFSSGSGTCADPYVIMTPSDLVDMHDDLALCYVLGQSIDMDGIEWVPLGTYDDPFTGVLNGAGFSISNLSATTVEIDYNFGIAYTMAMFGVIAGEAEISSLGLNLDYVYDSALDGENIMVGGLVAYVDSTDVTIQDIWVSGSIDVTTTGGDEFVSLGGVIGEAYLLYDLTDLSFTGTITSAVANVSYVSVGGLIGFGEDISIRNSKVFDITIDVSEEMYSDSYVGGLVGELDLYSTYLIDEGIAVFEKNVVDHLTINDTTGASIGGLVGYIYNGNDEYIWIEENLVTNSTLGDGSNYAGGLAGFAENIGFRQNQLTSVTIGSDIETDDLGGIVGYSYYCGIEDNLITDLSIIAGEYSNAIGGIAGMAEYSTFVRNYVSGSLISKGEYVGGIAGHAFGLDVGYSAFEGTLEGLRDVGGLVGYSESDRLFIYSSWSKGSIKATTDTENSNVGGLVGLAIQHELVILDSYSLADVEGNDIVGGLVGSSYDASTSIYRAYFGGTVTGTTNVDALIGLATESTPDVVENLYFDEDGGSSSWGTGVSKADLKDATSVAGLGLEASDQIIDYDLDSEWFVNENVNDGYLDVKADRGVLRYVDQDDEVRVQLSWGRINTYYYSSTNPNLVSLPYWRILGDEPTDPTREGYVFEGWYFDLGGSSEYLWDFNQNTYGDFAITAKWTSSLPDTGEAANLGWLMMSLGTILLIISKRKKV
jgi:uncharacterized repeat protein (TIGR02543 family)